MDRLLSRASVAAICAAWLVGCGSDENADLKTPVPTGVNQPAPAEQLPATLEGEISRAHDLRVGGSYDAAARAFAQLMLVAPDNVKVVSEYGKALLQQGRAEEAAPFLARAIQLGGADWTLYSALGVAYDQTNDHAKAKFAYEHALALKPHDPGVLNNYAASRMLAGDTGSAQRLFAEAEAAGADKDKIENNLEILADMKRSTESKPVEHVQAASVSTPPASTAPKTQTVAAVHKPQAVVTASALPPPAETPRHATGAPKQLANVVMEKVPVDPYAGPVQRTIVADKKPGQAVQHKTKLAAVTPAKAKTVADAAKPKTVTVADAAVKPAKVAKPTKDTKVANETSSVPVLRTAADGQ